jgi:Na(+)-translocating NADH:ubiquinone oxidoreductase B subunit
MKRILAAMKPLFQEGHALAPFSPVFDAFDSFLYSAQVPTTGAPYGRDPIDLKRVMTLVVIALLPPFVASLYFFGYRILLMLLVSYVAGAIVEVTFSVIRKEVLSEGFLVTGFLFPLIVPPGLPLWMVGVGAAFGVLVGKEVFGGTGRNLFNPALVGRVFLALGYPQAMTGNWISPGTGTWGRLAHTGSAALADAVTSATPLVLGKGGNYGSALDLFLGRVTGSAGETSAVAILIGGIFLVGVGIANWRTVLSLLATFTVLTAILHAVDPSTVGPVWFNLLSGGVLFGAFFMATDPVTGPVTQRGRYYYGFIIGAVTILIRSFSGFVEGMMFAILFGNICAPLIDEVIIRLQMRRFAREQ